MAHLVRRDGMSKIMNKHFFFFYFFYYEKMNKHFNMQLFRLNLDKLISLCFRFTESSIPLLHLHKSKNSSYKLLV